MSLGILFDIGKAYGSVGYTDYESGLITSLDLDVMQDEAHEWSNDVTSFPVEIGSPISDHIQSQPDKLSITGIISNSAIGVDALKKQELEEDRCQSAFDLLRKFHEDGTLLTVYTRYKVYVDMALKSCNIPRDAAIGDSLKFKMEFVHVRLVNTQTVDVPEGISKKLDKKEGGAKGSVAKKTQPQKKLGANIVGGDSAPLGGSVKSKSVADSIKDGLSKLRG